MQYAQIEDSEFLHNVKQVDISQERILTVATSNHGRNVTAHLQKRQSKTWEMFHYFLEYDISNFYGFLAF